MSCPREEREQAEYVLVGECGVRAVDSRGLYKLVGVLVYKLLHKEEVARRADRNYDYA